MISDIFKTTNLNKQTAKGAAQHTVRTGVLEVRRVPHEQHLRVGRVRDTDEARLVLQRGSDANAGSVGAGGAVVVGTTRSRPRHHLTHRHAGVLQPQDHRGNADKSHHSDVTGN